MQIIRIKSYWKTY